MYSDNNSPNIWSKAIENQFRVIWALILREIMTMYGRTKLGYIWVIIRILFGITIFYFLRRLIGRGDPWDMHLSVFLASGFIIFFMFTDCLTKCMNAVRGNKGLLDFPLIMPLDIILARVLLIAATNILAGAIILFGLHLAGIEFYITSPVLILGSIGMALALGTGAGLICMVLDKLFASTQIVVSFIIRILFFTSGVIFIVDDRFPYEVQKFVYLNPLYQIIEMGRCGLSRILEFQTSNVSLTYLTWFILISLFLGLLFERSTRGMTEVST